MRQQFGLSMILFGCGLSFFETAYFGWNLFPKTVAELVLDSICMALILFGVTLIWGKR